jgi:hypothetical protein
VGSTRHRLLSTTLAAAIETLAAAPSAARIAAFAATASPTAGDRISPTFRASHRQRARFESTPANAASGVDSLLHPVAGRHAHDERRSNTIALVRALRPSIARAVKNLRIVASAVLLLNFREVRDFHFCSTSAAM